MQFDWLHPVLHVVRQSRSAVAEHESSRHQSLAQDRFDELPGRHERNGPPDQPPESRSASCGATIRCREPIWRAASGLQRSTVLAIVDQLIDEGWVMEGAIGRAAARGRRPRFLHLNVVLAGIDGVDLRPETTTVGLADVDASFVAHTSWPTPTEPAVFVRELARTIAALRSAHPPVACARGHRPSACRGASAHQGRLMFAPNLGWKQVDRNRRSRPRPISRWRSRTRRMPARSPSSGSVVSPSMSGTWCGHGLGGIGVGLLLNGQLIHGADPRWRANSATWGIDDSGPLCKCGKRGCWERYGSNSAGDSIRHGLRRPPGSVQDPRRSRGRDSRTR